MQSDARGLFDPERIAVVGATERDGAIGRAIMENLERFSGEVVPINPKRDEVFGIQAYTDIESIPDPIDMAVVVVPPQIAVESARTLGENGVKNVVVITAGFGEMGEKGEALERELAEISDEYDLNLVGPNSIGIMSTSADMNASFGPMDALPGSLSFMSQSGAFITAVLDWANDKDIGFNDIVSLGNEAVLDETDFIEFWDEDEDTDVILGYLEGIDNGREFVDTAREVTEETPIVVVKSGRTEAGADAASSHTGTIAGSERAYEAGLEQAGVLRAENVEELFDFARVLAGQPTPEDDEVAVITNAGGPGVMATDTIGDTDLNMAELEDETVEELKEVLPEAANFYNPVDVLGDASVDRFDEAIDIVLQDENVSSAVVISCPTAVVDFEDLAETISSLQDKHGEPVVASLMGGERADVPEQTLREQGIPTYFDPARAVESLESLRTYRDITELEYESPTEFDVDRERAEEILRSVEDRDSDSLGVEAMDLLDAYGIPTPDSAIVNDPGAARDAAEDIEGDVVMKIVSPDILHKSDIGGVKVGVSEADVEETYEELLSVAHDHDANADILGVQVQEMVDMDSGTETIVGMNRDPQFGPMMLFGLGGIFVEVLEDTTVKVAPVSEREAENMIDEIESSPLLRGARGRDPVDESSVVESIQRLSQLVTDFPAISEIDVNPLLASPDGVTAADIRLTVDQDRL
ncbi:acetate--CoA ligase alpha subunit [Halanaeroarchaeum sulfurireducens]|uniref:acetate--CoA ligase (ADP-forming) n=1 Tax=Halanaeroarchaeum sulfurireducens TaxID=1604004 RepID=A0A0F7P9L0_9EURY|nr:acetate--CoA ligase [Halanaeroarchaeum sulfurireducens]AKH97826.1 acetyl-CoA synthetase [Halanaeroarchaeum sulfurireducens]